jgi:hypothetical protein
MNTTRGACTRDPFHNARAQFTDDTSSLASRIFYARGVRSIPNLPEYFYVPLLHQTVLGALSISLIPLPGPSQAAPICRPTYCTVRVSYQTGQLPHHEHCLRPRRPTGCVRCYRTGIHSTRTISGISQMIPPALITYLIILHFVQACCWQSIVACSNPPDLSLHIFALFLLAPHLDPRGALHELFK